WKWFRRTYPIRSGTGFATTITRDPVRMHNFYAYLYNRLVFETMQAAGKDGCLFARSATAGSQRFPVHWSGDCESTFEAMAESLRGGLSLAHMILAALKAYRHRHCISAGCSLGCC